jgi:hypothetical protein
MNRFQLSFSPFLLILLNFLPISASLAQFTYEVDPNRPIKIPYTGVPVVLTFDDFEDRVILKNNKVEVPLSDYFSVKPPTQVDAGDYFVTLGPLPNSPDQTLNIPIPFTILPFELNISVNKTIEVEKGSSFSLQPDDLVIEAVPSNVDPDALKRELTNIISIETGESTGGSPGDNGTFKIAATDILALNSLISHSQNLNIEEDVVGDFIWTKTKAVLQPRVRSFQFSKDPNTLTTKIILETKADPGFTYDELTNFEYIIQYQENSKEICRILVTDPSHPDQSPSDPHEYDSGVVLPVGKYTVSISAQHQDYHINTDFTKFEVLQADHPGLDDEYLDNLKTELGKLTILDTTPIELLKTDPLTNQTITWVALKGGVIKNSNFYPKPDSSLEIELSYSIDTSENYKLFSKKVGSVDFKDVTFNLQLFPEYLPANLKVGDEFDPYDPKWYDRIPSGFEPFFKADAVNTYFKITSNYSPLSPSASPNNWVFDSSSNLYTNKHQFMIVTVEIQIGAPLDTTNFVSSVQRVVSLNAIDQSVAPAPNDTPALPSGLLRNPSNITLWGSGDNAPKDLTEGWYETEWLGLYYRTDANHIYHSEIGWLYIPDEYKDSNPVWAYSYLRDANGDELGWLYFGARTPTNDDTMDRYIGSYNEENKSVNWLWYVGPFPNRLLFFNYTTYEYLWKYLP